VVNDDLDDGPRRTAADALAPLSAQLTTEQRSLIHTALNGDGLRNRFSVYRALVEVTPDLIPPSAAEAALHQIEETAQGPTPGEEASLSAHPDALEIATLGLTGSADADLSQRAVAQVLATTRAFAGKAELAAELERAGRLLAGLDSAAVETWNQLAQELLSNWGAYLPEAHRALISFIAEFLPRAANDVQQQVPVTLLDQLFADPVHALAVIEELDPLPELLRPAILDRLVAYASDPSHWQAGIAALTKLAGDEASERIATVFTQLLAAGHLDVAAQLLAAEDSHLQPRIEELAERAAPHLQERVNSDEPLPVELFEPLAEAMSPERIASLAALVAARLRDGAPANATELVAALGQRPRSRLRDFIAANALDLLVGMDSFTPELAPLLGAVCANVPRLGSARQAQLATKLSEWLRAHPGQLSLLSQNILTINGLAPEPAKILVEGLLDTERATEDAAVRRELLNAAFHLKAKPNSRAIAAVRKRIGELEAGSEVDQRIAAEFAGRLASPND
jgi:hypothetical protein